VEANLPLSVIREIRYARGVEGGGAT
jgi:hypothetical protein